jgi:putative phosphoesterase
MIAALYDIHGNLPALDAVLTDVERSGATEIIIGGDVVPGPMPREVFDRLARVKLPMRYIIGNGDREILARLRGQPGPVAPQYEPMMSWVADQLDASHERLIAGWPATLRANVPELGSVVFCHATPRNDMDIVTRLTSENDLAPIIEPANVDVVICGHTHMQYDRMVGRTRVVNAGSVGMPFGDPGAYWLLIGKDIELRHTRYDLEAAAAAIRATTYPGADAFAHDNVLSPPAEQKMLELYSSVRLQ